MRPQTQAERDQIGMALAHVAFGSLADICAAEITIGSTNESARNVRFCQNCPNAFCGR